MEKDIYTAQLKYNNYVEPRKVKALFKGMPFICTLRNVDIDGQKRGCTGFIVNSETGKTCYIDTEPFFDGGEGSGLWNDPNKAVMMRTAENVHDYTGGRNQWLPLQDIVSTAVRLTS